jgi:hypothetical protein
VLNVRILAVGMPRLAHKPSQATHASREVYPRGMAGKPAEPTHSGQISKAPCEQDGESTERDERVGPVVIARHIKDDGRVLILYTLDRPPQT